MHQYGKQDHLLNQTFLVAGAFNPPLPPLISFTPLFTFDGKSWIMGSTSISPDIPVLIRHHISDPLVIATFLVFDGMFFSQGLFSFTVTFCRSYLLIFIIYTEVSLQVTWLGLEKLYLNNKGGCHQCYCPQLPFYP